MKYLQIGSACRAGERSLYSSPSRRTPRSAGHGGLNMRTLLLVSIVTVSACQDDNRRLDALEAHAAALEARLAELQQRPGIPGPAGPKGETGPSGTATEVPHLIGPGGEDLGFFVDTLKAFRPDIGAVVDSKGSINIDFQARDCAGEGTIGMSDPNVAAIGPHRTLLKVPDPSNHVPPFMTISSLVGGTTFPPKCKNLDGLDLGGNHRFVDTGVYSQWFYAREVSIELR